MPVWANHLNSPAPGQGHIGRTEACVAVALLLFAAPLVTLKLPWVSHHRLQSHLGWQCKHTLRLQEDLFCSVVPLLGTSLLTGYRGEGKPVPASFLREKMKSWESWVEKPLSFLIVSREINLVVLPDFHTLPQFATKRKGSL